MTAAPAASGANKPACNTLIVGQKRICTHTYSIELQPQESEGGADKPRRVVWAAVSSWQKSRYHGVRLRLAVQEYD